MFLKACFNFLVQKQGLWGYFQGAPTNMTNPKLAKLRDKVFW